ncbi:MAG: class I SAM-dependent methyltransferase [Bacteroidetes bacterium]|nr:class I SAM-dependent methyltransferase [Bacteroidota bacterium]
MLNELYRTVDYLEYLLVSDTRHGTHSPFVYRLLEDVFYVKNSNPVWDGIEQIRKEMLQSNSRIELVDLGSGNRNGLRKLSEITHRTARGAKYGRLLHRLIAMLQPQNCIELGTGTGITALYQASAFRHNQVLHTLEGAPALCEIASFNAQRIDLAYQIEVHQGDFANTLPELLQNLQQVDYAYIDGNHTFEATTQYFLQLLPHLHTQSVLVFDDIYWNEEMRNAWTFIKNHANVTVTIDIFAFGLVFFRPEQAKEHFRIRY